ncbi:MAG: ABC transporter substrate-binding protein [Lachnospiraceae bacterium]|nr:ABC transporter substrate-binding protein [Lachnospiraceae bacterium]
MKKKLLAMLLCTALGVSVLSGCGSATEGGEETGAQESTSVEGNVLYHAYASLPYVTLDPSSENSNGVMILKNVYETLSYYNDETGEVEPALATSWTSNEDGTEWVFELRDDVTFHDGTQMTAKSVVDSINRTMEIGQGAAYIWDSVEKVEATGDYQVTFTCSYSASIDLIASAAYAAYIMSEEAAAQDSDWFNAGNDGGSGPYTIAQATGDTCVLKAYADYRDGWQDNQYQNVIVREVSESSARRQLLETGEAQISSGFSSTDLEALRAETDKVNIYEAKTFINVTLCLNSEADYMDNADFRRALSYAFPYEETVNNVLGGTGVQSHGMIPSGLWGHDDTMFQYNFDLEKAQEYLDKSGVDVSQGITLDFTYPTGDDSYATFAQLWQSNLKKLGIDLEINAMEWDAQWDKAKNTEPNDRQDILCFMWWPDYADPSSWFISMVHSEDTINYGFAYMNDPEIDALIDDAQIQTASNRDAAEQDYIEIQKKLVDDANFIFPYDLTTVYALSPAVENVKENPAYPSAIDYYKVTMK